MKTEDRVIALTERYVKTVQEWGNYMGTLTACASDEVEQIKNRADDMCGALVLGANALREKMEREKGCEYCKQAEPIAYGKDSLMREGYIYLDENLLTADLYWESMAAAVCYCPMCGRKLGVEHDG